MKYDFAIARGVQEPVYPGFSLADETLGIVGLGDVGRVVARLARALGMRVIAADPYRAGSFEGVELVGLDELLRRSRIVSLHAKLTDETRYLIGPAELRRMRSDAILINTARGALIDNGALAAALREGRIAAAGLDVFEDEPDFAANPLLDCPNVILTPHTAGLTEWGIRRQSARCVDIVEAILAGRVPDSLANPEALPHARIHLYAAKRG